MNHHYILCRDNNERTTLRNSLAAQAGGVRSNGSMTLETLEDSYHFYCINSHLTIPYDESVLSDYFCVTNIKSIAGFRNVTNQERLIRSVHELENALGSRLKIT